MGRNGERGRDEEGWKGHGVVRSEGGMGNRPHSPELIVACVLIVTHVLVVTRTLVIVRVHSWALAIICEPWWPFWLVVVRAHRGLWVMVKGACRCPVVAHPFVAVTSPLPRVVILLISKRGWEEHGMVGYLPCS